MKVWLYKCYGKRNLCSYDQACTEVAEIEYIYSIAVMDVWSIFHIVYMIALTISKPDDFSVWRYRFEYYCPFFLIWFLHHAFFFIYKKKKRRKRTYIYNILVFQLLLLLMYIWSCINVTHAFLLPNKPENIIIVKSIPAKRCGEERR